MFERYLQAQQYAASHEVVKRRYGYAYGYAYAAPTSKCSPTRTARQIKYLSCGLELKPDASSLAESRVDMAQSS